MKRVFIFLVMLLVAAVVPFAKGAQEQEKATVTWWKAPHFEDEQGKWKPIIAKFEGENPNITIEHTVTTWEGWLEKHLPAYISGTPPDVCYVSSDFFPTLAQQKFLQPLEEIDPKYVSQMKEYTYPRCLDATSYNKKVMGVPQGLGSLFFIYNKVLFEKAGLAPDKPPKTWDEVVEYGQKIVSTGTAKYGLVWPASPPEWLGFGHWDGYTVQMESL